MYSIILSVARKKWIFSSKQEMQALCPSVKILWKNSKKIPKKNVTCSRMQGTDHHLFLQKFEQTLFDVKEDLALVLTMGREITEKRQVDFPERFAAQLAHLEKKHQDLKSQVGFFLISSFTARAERSASFMSSAGHLCFATAWAIDCASYCSA